MSPVTAGPTFAARKKADVTKGFPVQGRLVGFPVRLRGASRVLKIGRLGGYSTIRMARGLPAGGRLITSE